MKTKNSLKENIERINDIMNLIVEDKLEKKHTNTIKKVLDRLLVEPNKDIICGVRVRNDKNGNEYDVVLYMIGGYNTKYWPRTQKINKIYHDFIKQTENYIKDTMGIEINVSMSITSSCNEYNKNFKNE